MSFKITPAVPFPTPFGFSIDSVYAAIDVTTHVRRTGNISLEVEYYKSAADCQTGQPLPIGITRRFSLLAEPDATTQPSRDELERFVAAELTREYGIGLAIDFVA